MPVLLQSIFSIINVDIRRQTKKQTQQDYNCCRQFNQGHKVSHAPADAAIGSLYEYNTPGACLFKNLKI